MNEKMNVRLKMRIFEMRKEQKEFAREIGISPTTLSTIVQGKSDPKVSTALKIAKELGTTVEYLWGDDSEK